MGTMKEEAEINLSLSIIIGFKQSLPNAGLSQF